MFLKYYLFDKNYSPTLLKPKYIYTRKKFMTDTEYKFYLKFLPLTNNYIIIPQVNLASIIEKKEKGFCNELFRNIDYAIFDNNFNLLLLIELNDKTHNNVKRHNRDLKVKKILESCNIKLLTFYTHYPNDKDYVLNRITKAIEKNN